MVTRLSRAVWPILLLAFATSCARSGPGVTHGEVRARAAAQDRAIIRTAMIRLAVREISPSVDELGRIAETVQGHVERVSATRDQGATLVLRVPSERLEATLDRISSLGDEKERTVTATDVTEQVADLEAALANNTALRDRLRTLLDRAKTVEEILAVEKELNRIQTLIDQQQARLDRISSQVALSRVTVHLERQRVLGPLGHVIRGIAWVVRKLFVLQD